MIKKIKFKKLQKFLKDLKKAGYTKDIFKCKKIISPAYNNISYYIHIRYIKGNKYWEIKKEIFPSFELQGFWALKYRNNKLSEKFYIKEYEFKGDDYND